MKEEGVWKPARNPSAGMIRIRFSGLAREGLSAQEIEHPVESGEDLRH